MWCHLPTIFDRRRTLLIPALVTFIVVLFTALVFAHAAGATTGINKTINFQGRLLNSQGATVPDGYYNIQFKIYQDGDGQSAGDSTGSPAGSLKWTETYINNNAQAGVQVKNGFLSVNLGSQTAFGGSIDWNQDTLWLSMNVAGSDNGCTTYNAGTCPADGEMTPMKRLTAMPYALNAGALNGLTSSNFVQFAQGTVQGDSSANSSIFINKTGTGSLLELQSSGTDSFVVNNTGNLSFGNNANHTLNVATAPASTAGNSLTIASGAGGSGTGFNGGDLVLQGGGAGGTNANGGNMTIDAGVKAGTGTDGNINIGTSHASTIQIGSTSTASNQTINIGNNGGAGTTNVNIGSSVAGTTAVTGPTTITNRTSGSADTFVVSNSTSTGTIAKFQNNSTSVFTLANGGAATFSNQTNSLNGFQVQNASGTSLLNLDTTNSILTIGDTENTASFNNIVGGIGKYSNLLQYSEDIGNNAVWTKTNVTLTTANDPTYPAIDGQNTAETLTSSAAGGTVTQTCTTGCTTAGTYTFSVWIRSTSGTQPFSLRVDGTGGSWGTGTAVNYTATTTWQRFVVNSTFSGAGTNLTARLAFTNNSEALVAWGGQMVAGTSPQVYVRTVGTALTSATYGLVDRGSALFQNAANSTTAFQVQAANGTSLFTADTQNSRVTVAGSFTYTDSAASATAAVCKDGSGYLTACNTTGNGAFFIQGGNNFGGDAVLGTTQSGQQLTFKTGGTNRLTLDSTGANFTFQQAATINTNGALALGLDTGGAAALSIGTANTNALSIGNTSGSFTAESNGTANLFNGNTAHTIQMATASGTTQTVTIGSTNSSSKTTIQGGAYSLVARNTGIGVNTGTNAPTADLTFGDNGGSGRSINVLQRTSNAAGDALTISAGQGGSGASANAGGNLNLNGGAASGTGNAAGGDVNINGGAKNASGTDGNINIGTTRANNVNLQSTNQTTVTTNGVQRATFDNAGDLILGNGVQNATPANFTIQGTASTTSGTAGSSLTIQGGNGTTGNTNGGNLTLSGGTGFGSGVNGLVVLATPTFQTTGSVQTCSGSSTSLNMTQASVDSNGVVSIASTSSASCVISMPNPTITTAGRIVYVTADGSSTSSFTLSVNGGGVGNIVSMRAYTTATMVWNGAAWTAAGASSSTTLQSAYDNTIQSSGGAELIVSKTAATNGLTIRDSTTNSVNGTLLQVQSKTAANIFSVSSNVSDYASDNGAETAGGSSSTFPSSTWAATGSATVTRNTTTNNNTIATGQASVSVATSTSANSGVSNQIIDPTAGSAVALTASTQYNVSLSARLPSGAGIFNNLTVLYQYDGTSGHTVTCTSGVSIAQTSWTKINCSFTTPSSAITSANVIRIEQANSGTARTFYVDNLSVTIAAGQNYATDGGVDSALGTNWVAVGGSATQSTTNGFTASDSAQVTTTASSTSGIKNKLSANPIASTASTTYLYLISVEVQTQVTALTNFTIQYAYDGSTMTNCLDYNTQAVSTSSTQWTKITCMIQTPTNAPTTPYVFFTQGDTTVRTSSLFIDAFSMTLANSTTPDVQIGSGTNGGPVTLFTLDSAASAPIAANNASLYGSMYYDTTQGKIQCYQLSGWGSCGASPDNIVTISPEYTNAVMHGTGVGTMTSDFCSDLLNINNSVNPPVVCGTNETYNFYKWTSPQATAQTYSIYVTYQLPGTFKGFTSGATSLQGKTDSANSTVQYSIYKNSGSGLTRCGTTTVPVSTGVQTSWQTGVATGAIDPSTCSFSSGNSILFKIDVTSSSNANAYVGNLNFTFSNR